MLLFSSLAGCVGVKLAIPIRLTLNFQLPFCLSATRYRLI